MLNQLKIRGLDIIRELELGGDQTTEKWMAHYLAELMERSEKAETSELREQAANQSSEIILTLWEQKTKKARHEYYSALNTAFEQVYEKRPFAEMLKLVLSDPDQLEEIDGFSDKISLLFYLIFYETDLCRISLIADIVSKMPKNDITEVVVKRFEQAEALFVSTKRHLQDVWPETAQISLEQTNQLQNFISIKLQELHQVRGRLLEKMEWNEI